MILHVLVWLLRSALSMEQSSGKDSREKPQKRSLPQPARDAGPHPSQPQHRPQPASVEPSEKRNKFFSVVAKHTAKLQVPIDMPDDAFVSFVKQDPETPVNAEDCTDYEQPSAAFFDALESSKRGRGRPAKNSKQTEINNRLKDVRQALAHFGITWKGFQNLHYTKFKRLPGSKTIQCNGGGFLSLQSKLAENVPIDSLECEACKLLLHQCNFTLPAPGQLCLQDGEVDQASEAPLSDTFSKHDAG